MKAYCVVLAGGIGTRMGGDVPKQLLPLCGEPIIVRTIKRVMECKRFAKVIVAIHPAWTKRCLEMFANSGIDMARILVAEGGRERHDSILNAIQNDGDVTEEDVAVIHDAVRPFVSLEMLEDSIRVASEFGACVAAVPAVDTMLEVVGGVVRSVPPRATLFHGQAPDTAKILLLKRALISLTDEERKSITGTAQILVAKGIPVKTISGDARNIKITTPADMELAERYLEVLDK